MKKYHFFHESLLLLFENVGKIILETSLYYLYFMRGAPASPPGWWHLCPTHLKNATSTT